MVRVFKKLVLLLDVVVVLVIAVVVVVHIPPDDPSNIPPLYAAELSHTPQSVCANDDAEWNMKPMLVTLKTSHLERSLLNDDAE